jgi:AcrR family transcriptional regulator
LLGSGAAGYPPAMAGTSEKGRRARPGGHPLRPEVVSHHQRQRILAGAATVIAQRGYRQVTVADIVKSAAIARARFYENFASKEDCFFALYDDAAAGALDAVKKECESTFGEFPDRVRAGIAGLLVYLESNPQLARVCVVEGPVVGPAINERFERLIGDFAVMLRGGREEATGAELPVTVEETVIGGLYWLLYYALLEERPKRIAKLLPQLTEFSLIPFIGAEAARTAITG